MTSSREALLAHVLADPEDLDARAVYADVLSSAGDPRGELIAIACELARTGLATVDAMLASAGSLAELARAGAMHRRARQLAAEHDATWRGDLADAIGARLPVASFADGFVSTIGMTDVGRDAQVATFAALLAREPVRSLSISIAPELRAAFADLPLDGLHRLALWCRDDGDGLADVFAAATSLTSIELVGRSTVEHIAALPAHPSIRSLRLHDPTEDCLDALAEHPLAPQLEHLDIGRTYLRGNRPLDAMRLLDGRFPRARSLGLRFANLTDDILVRRAADLAIPEALDLSEMELGARGLAALAGARGIDRLARLRLTSLDEAALAALLAGNPACLESLVLDDALFGAAGCMRLAQAPLPRLRRLDLGTCAVGPDPLAALLRARGLARLAIRGGNAAPIARAIAREPRAAELRELVLDGAVVPEDIAVMLAGSPHVAGLRRLGLARASLTDGGLAAIAGSPHLGGLVALDVDSNCVRVAVPAAAFPALVELRAAVVGDEAELAAVRARFGDVPGGARSLDLVILFDEGRLANQALERAMRDAGFHVDAGTGGKPAVRLRGYPNPIVPANAGAMHAIAAAYAAPAAIRDAVAALRGSVELAPAGIGARAGAAGEDPLVHLGEAIARACRGIVWDRYHDTIADHRDATLGA